MLSAAQFGRSWYPANAAPQILRRPSQSLATDGVAQPRTQEAHSRMSCVREPRAKPATTSSRRVSMWINVIWMTVSTTAPDCGSASCKNKAGISGRLFYNWPRRCTHLSASEECLAASANMAKTSQLFRNPLKKNSPILGVHQSALGASN